LLYCFSQKHLIEQTSYTLREARTVTHQRGLVPGSTKPRHERVGARTKIEIECQVTSQQRETGTEGITGLREGIRPVQQGIEGETKVCSQVSNGDRIAAEACRMQHKDVCLSRNTRRIRSSRVQAHPDEGDQENEQHDNREYL